MSGNKIGGRKAAKTNLAKDPDFYSKMGSKGQQAYLAQPKHLRLPRGFAANRELARIVGAKGGRKSRRTK